MQPEAVALGDVGHPADRVERRRRRRPGRGDDRAGPAAGGAVLGDRLLEQIGAQRVLVVGRDQAQVLGAEAGEQRRFGDRAVRLVRGVDDERRLLGLQSAAVLAEARRALAGAEQGAERRRAGAVVDHAAEGLGQADHLPQPVHDHVLDLGRRGARLPAHALGAETRRDEVGEHRGEVGVGGEVGEPAGVVPVRDARQHDALEVGDDVAEALALLRRLGRQLRRDLAGLDAAHDREFVEALAVGGDPLDQLVAQRAELGGIHRWLLLVAGRASRCRRP